MNILKLHKLVTSAIVASYSIGMANAATGLAVNQVVSVNKSAIVSHQMLSDTNTAVATTGSLNNIITKNQNSKFDYETSLFGNHTYMVVLHDKPTPYYDNAIKGSLLSHKSKQASSNEISLRYPSKAAYKNHLLAKQQSVLINVKQRGFNVSATYNYTSAINGFTIEVDQATAAAISENSDVAKVVRLGFSQMQSYSTPKDVGAPAIWNGDSEHSNTVIKGEGVVVAVFDSGINSDHPSFSDNHTQDSETKQTEDGHSYPETSTFYGECAAGNDDRCNNKLIGIYSYPEVFNAVHGKDNIAPLPTFNDALEEGFIYRAGEDYNGHGSAVASIIAGNSLEDITFHYPKYKDWSSKGVPLTIGAHDVSGIAPHAQIISYQVCDPIANATSCSDEAIFKAIEDAINDGVDVINHAIARPEGAKASPYLEASIDLAFLSAHQAGIVVVTAVGNGANYKVAYGDHGAPWLLSVGSVYKSDAYNYSSVVNEISGGDSETSLKELTGGGLAQVTIYRSNTGYTGQAFAGSPVVAEAIVDTSNYSESQLDALKSCTELPANTFVSTEIAVCLVNELANTDLVSDMDAYQTYQHMATQVENAGAGGMMMLPAHASAPGLTVAYANNFPATFARTPIMSGVGSNYFYEWILTSNNKEKPVFTTIQPMTEFKLGTLLGFMSTAGSSVGPADGIEGEYLLPSVVAPGVDVFAASADERPYDSFGNSTNWLPQTGSSIASASVTGSVALIKQAHPTWSPSEIISALTMTAARATGVTIEALGNTISPWLLDNKFGSKFMEVRQGQMMWGAVSAVQVLTTITSPEMTVNNTGDFSFDFFHIYEFEVGEYRLAEAPETDPFILENWDGGVIEISVEGDEWQDIMNFQTQMTPAYPGVIQGTFPLIEAKQGNPLGHRHAFVGSTGAKGEEVSIAIPEGQLNGKKVQLRFAIGTDPQVTTIGWFVDDLTINNTQKPVFSSSVAERHESCVDRVPMINVVNKRITADEKDAQGNFTQVELSASAFDLTSDNTVDTENVSLTWVQTEGKEVVFNQTVGETVSFTAPNVALNTNLTFEVTATDVGGNTKTEEVFVTIIDINVDPEVIAIEGPTLVTEGDTVVLTVNAVDADGDNLLFHWRQAEDDVQPVNINDVRSRTMNFIAPNITETTVVNFSVTTSDDYTEITETVSVTIEPVASNVTNDGGSFGWLAGFMLVISALRRSVLNSSKSTH